MAARGSEQAQSRQGWTHAARLDPGLALSAVAVESFLYSALTEDDPDPLRPARAAGPGP